MNSLKNKFNSFRGKLWKIWYKVKPIALLFYFVFLVLLTHAQQPPPHQPLHLDPVKDKLMYQVATIWLLPTIDSCHCYDIIKGVNSCCTKSGNGCLTNHSPTERTLCCSRIDDP